jgi:hypothetical protein
MGDLAMKALLATMRTLSGSAALARSSTATGIGPVELTGAQLEQVVGGGGLLGGAVNDRTGSLMPSAGSHNGSGGDM